MSTQGRSNSLDDVLKLITRLARKSADGNYLFRGEPECYDRVSSNLYRLYCKEADNPGFDIEDVQRENINEAKRYTKETDDLEILTELQHYGGKTNLIDFTTDYLIALFFSCDGSPEREGRVILLKETGRVDFRVIRPRNPANRVLAQKSVFVRPTKGYVVPDAIVPVPPDLKQPTLDYLRTRHGISTETIYNDLFGFIRIQDLYQSAYAEFYKGLFSGNEGNLQQAIGHYSKSIELNPQMPGPYNNRGVAYSQEGDIDRALQDYDKALALDPKHPLAYENRGEAYHSRGDLDRAIRDYDRALALNSNSASAYSNRGNAYHDKGDLDRAIQDLNNALELEPNLASAYFNRASVYLERKEFDRAFQDYDSGLALEPENAHAYSNRGTAYLTQGDIDRAFQDLNKALELLPDNAPAYFNRGIIWLCLSEWANAKSDLATAMSQGLDIVAAYADHAGIESFEQKHGVTLPADIRSMLT